MTKEELFDNLDFILKDCSEPNWDSYGADPTNPASVENVKKLVSMLPEGIPIPICVPENTGDIGLEWFNNWNCVISISINTTKRIAYYWEIGEEQSTGVVEFDEFPKWISELIIKWPK